MKLVKVIGVITAVLLVAVFSFSCASSGGAAAEPVEGYRWSFVDVGDSDITWYLNTEDFWEYRGESSIGIDEETFGRGMLRVDLDFTRDSGNWWSEPKIRFDFEEPFDLTGITRFNFDFYYSPEYYSTGSFKFKLVNLDGTRTVNEFELESFRPSGEEGDFMVANISMRVPRSTRSIGSVVLGIVGAVTNYNGPVFFDNIRFE